MSISVSPTIADTLPSTVKQALGKMPDESQATFEEEYKRKKRNPVTLLICSLFGIHYFVQGEIGKGLLFVCTLGGLWIWWTIDIFTTYGKSKRFNDDLAVTIMRDMKVMGA